MNSLASWVTGPILGNSMSIFHPFLLSTLWTVSERFCYRVELAVNMDTNTKCALKIMSQGMTVESMRDIAKNEANWLVQLDHPHIIKCYGYSEETVYCKDQRAEVPYYLLELEIADNGDLFDYVKHTGKFSEKEARYFYTQLLSAIEHMNSKGYSHRDIKLENMILDDTYNLKLVDFGFATKEDLSDNKTGTSSYMAPEVAFRKSYSWASADLFSAAVCLFLMVVGHFPFKNATKKDRTYKYIISNDMKKFWKSHEKKSNSKLSGLSCDFKNFFENWIFSNQDERLTIEEIKKHPWFTAEWASPDIIFDSFKMRQKVFQKRNKQFSIIGEKSELNFPEGNLSKSETSKNKKLNKNKGMFLEGHSVSVDPAWVDPKVAERVGFELDTLFLLIISLAFPFFEIVTKHSRVIINLAENLYYRTSIKKVYPWL